MKLSVVKDGLKLPYSFQQLRKGYPDVSFPRDLTGVDLTQYGVIVEEGEPAFMESPTVRQDFSAFISRRAEYLQDVAKDFGLSGLYLDFIFAEANKIGM